jgi:hypothetical protein
MKSVCLQTSGGMKVLVSLHPCKVLKALSTPKDTMFSVLLCALNDGTVRKVSTSMSDITCALKAGMKDRGLGGVRMANADVV